MSASRDLSPTITGATPEGAASCTCIAEMNAKLAEYNGGIVSTMFGKPPRAAVEVYQLETGRGKKRPPKAIASFCPFCGQKYAASQASGEGE